MSDLVATLREQEQAWEERPLVRRLYREWYARFLDEVERTLASGGRLVMIEPYCSPISTPLYRGLHQERTDTAADPFAPDPEIAHAAFDSNQALPTLVFFRRVAELQLRWPTLRLVEQKRFAFLLYPLSGGFTRRPLLPRPLYPVVRLIERALRPLAPVLAFRCLVVLEKS